MAECKKYICVHGHFYQPPRENAWLEEIEIQESAHPYHDWNERITQECYRPNSVSRILNDAGKIADIVNNYIDISFNFGPTLLSWLEIHQPDVYQRIIDADMQSIVQFEGHGSAIAQVYNHIIMPLANRRDKETQIIWGIEDFKKRFGRNPEGMWLAETAVDTETLEILAENKIKFTILSPYQAARFRRIGTNDWIPGIDSRRAYVCNLPSGKSIAIFFYHAELSQGVAFKGYLNDGKFFAHQLMSAFDPEPAEPQLVHIATDGESYGHHHRNGDMALAYCIHYLKKQPDIKIANYGYFLRKFPPQYEVQIQENSSWSCAHGVERWRSDCGCKTGGEPHWNQKWRKPLREALDYLRDELAEIFESKLKEYHPDPWDLRNKYIHIFQQRSRTKTLRFIEQYIGKDLKEEEIITIIRALEMQRMALYMYTSCGWFFNEISGIETIQILQYAERAIQLAEDVTQVDLYPRFLEILSQAQSNIPSLGTGADIYRNMVVPKRLSLTQVGMHYAVSTLFEEDARNLTVLNYECTSEELTRIKAGGQLLVIGQTKVRSKVTQSQKRFSFVILYLGNHHLIGNTADSLSYDEYASLVKKFREYFDAGNLTQVLELIKDNFASRTFSFFDLFKDEQKKLLDRVLNIQVKNALDFYERINERTFLLLNLMHKEGLTIPEILITNLKTLVIQNLYDELSSPTLPDIEKIHEIEQIILKWKFRIPTERLNYAATLKINTLVEEYKKNQNIHLVVELSIDLLNSLKSIGIMPQLNELQDLIFTIIKEGKFPQSEMFGVLLLANKLGMEIRGKISKPPQKPA